MGSLDGKQPFQRKILPQEVQAAISKFVATIRNYKGSKCIAVFQSGGKKIGCYGAPSEVARKIVQVSPHKTFSAIVLLDMPTTREPMYKSLNEEQYVKELLADFSGGDTNIQDITIVHSVIDTL